MRGAPESMELLRPLTAAEAVADLSRKPSALILAGGTDLMVSWNAGLLNRRVILDLSRVSQWRKITEVRGGLMLGSLATHAQLQEHPALRRRFPLLAAACATVGAAQIQNRGTLGGNIANASPAGDTFPALAVYEAVVHAVSSRGRRRIAITEFFSGVKKSVLASGELIEAIELADPPTRPQREFFRKVGTRQAQAISKTVAAGLLWLGKDGRVRELRFALGSMAPTVRRLKTVEAFVTGRKLTPETAATAAGLLINDVSPIDDIRSTARYRLTVSENLLRAFLESGGRR